MILRRFRNPSLVPLGEVAAAGLGFPAIESGVSAGVGIFGPVVAFIDAIWPA